MLKNQKLKFLAIIRWDLNCSTKSNFEPLSGGIRNMFRYWPKCSWILIESGQKWACFIVLMAFNVSHSHMMCVSSCLKMTTPSEVDPNVTKVALDSWYVAFRPASCFWCYLMIRKMDSISTATRKWKQYESILITTYYCRIWSNTLSVHFTAIHGWLV